MTKAEKKLLQRKEAELFLEKEQYIDWFGKASTMAKRATCAWLAVYDVLEMLGIDGDVSLPDNKKAWEMLSERNRLEAELKTEYYK